MSAVTADEMNERTRGRLAGELGMEFISVAPNEVVARLEVRDAVRNTLGTLHAAAIVAIADTACGAGTLAGLPADSGGFITLELKTNFVGALSEGAVRCLARPRHVGKRTHVWEATIESESSGKPIAYFSCTQLLLERRHPA
jgi:uncharacterized protein (TIGR00369 family)